MSNPQCFGPTGKDPEINKLTHPDQVSETAGADSWLSPLQV